jgi:hypothetical protein
VAAKKREKLQKQKDKEAAMVAAMSKIAKREVTRITRAQVAAEIKRIEAEQVKAFADLAEKMKIEVIKLAKEQIKTVVDKENE